MADKDDITNKAADLLEEASQLLRSRTRINFCIRAATKKQTFEVDFMGEMAKGSGGPRKEWIQLINVKIKEKYSDHGLQAMLETDYYFFGVMIGYCITAEWLAS
eukprot:gene17115-8638_t